MIKNSDNTVCAVVVTFNRKELLLECLKSLLKQTYPLEAIYLIDNSSTDGTPEALKENNYIEKIPDQADRPVEQKRMLDLLSDTHQGKQTAFYYLRLTDNTGGAGGFYEGMKMAHEKGYGWLWMMDDDSEPKEDALEKMSLAFDRPDLVALAGPVVLPDGEISYSHRGMMNSTSTYPTIQEPLSAEMYKEKEVEIDIVSLVGILVKTTAVEKIGFPKKEFFIRHDDVEYCIRLRKFGKILLINDSKIIHKEASQQGIRKSFLGRESFRISYEKFWITYFAKRNLVWLGKMYSNNRPYYYFETLKSISRSLLDVLMYDDNKVKRMCLVVHAYLDGLRGNFDNKKSKKILYGQS